MLYFLEAFKLAAVKLINWSLILILKKVIIIGHCECPSYEALINPDSTASRTSLVTTNLIIITLDLGSHLKLRNLKKLAQDDLTCIMSPLFVLLLVSLIAGTSTEYTFAGKQP